MKIIIFINHNDPECFILLICRGWFRNQQYLCNSTEIPYLIVELYLHCGIAK